MLLDIYLVVERLLLEVVQIVSAVAGGGGHLAADLPRMLHLLLLLWVMLMLLLLLWVVLVMLLGLRVPGGGGGVRQQLGLAPDRNNLR